jgi:hypothetical protein
MTKKLEQALDYLDRGWSIIPINPETKRPLIKWRDYQARQPTSDEVETWFETWPECKLAVVTGELAERARVVNEVIQPDALISLHINAAAWPKGDSQKLVAADHAHVLIFGCLSAQELATPAQRERLVKKITNGSGAVEAVLGAALGSALAEAPGLPASEYEGNNAIRIDSAVPSLWARNLMLLRLVDCPAVLMEPYIANSQKPYARIQEALRARQYHEPLPADDILVEYADAVVKGVLWAYGGGTKEK